MKLKFLAVAAFAALAFTACEDTTDSLGNSLTDKMDNMEVSYATFGVKTNSFAVDSIYANGADPVLGRIKDPETGAYVTADYMTQFFPAIKIDLPDLSHIDSKDENGNVYADSCFLQIWYNNVEGDSTQKMSASIYELSKPVKEGAYYSNFDPVKEGYVSKSNYGSQRSYTLSANGNTIKFPLNHEYTKVDKDGNKTTYNNYGTYLISEYYKDKSNFQNPYKFIQNITPGFFIEHTGGNYNLATVYDTQIVFYFRNHADVEETATDGTKTTTTKYYSNFYRVHGTEEVLQTTKIDNDKESIKRLLADNSCTYVKSPAGIFTEVEIPVLDIMKGHENDTLNNVKITFPKVNNTTNSEFSLKNPTYMLMLPKDSTYTFFEKGSLFNNKTSYITTLSTSTTNGYTFSNISGLVFWMYQNYKKAIASGKQPEEGWNKAVLVPVNAHTTTSSSGKSINSISSKMSLSSVKLKQGTEDDPIQISVIYSRFKEKK